MTRRHWFNVVLSALMAPRSPGGTREGEFVVIVHRSNRFDALSRSRLSFLFLRKVSRWPWGAEVEPIDLPSHWAARREFTRQVLRTTEEQLAEYWIDQRATRGVISPARVLNAAAAKALVAARPGAIAYIPADQIDNTIKVIKVDP